MSERLMTCKSISIATLLVAMAAIALAQSRDPFADARLQMVRDFIEAEGVRNPRVLLSMRTVLRHEFVRPSLRRQAYLDSALPIGYRQTISPPFIVAYMTETIDPQPDDRVLEIGTGSGYQAAVLSSLVKGVYTIEIVEQLGRSAAQRLKRLGYDNVHAKVGDGYKGWPEHAPFDKIIVTCSPEDVPTPLAEQLKEGGKMIIPLGRRYQQVFHLLEKRDGKLQETKLIPTLFVPMTGISEEQREVKPDPLNPQVVNGDFEAGASEGGLPDHWHYRRKVKLAEDDAPQGKSYAVFENADRGSLSQLLQGMALDGRSLAKVTVRLSVRHDGTEGGLQQHEQPALVVYFYDTNRRPISEAVIGPWLGTREWHRVSKEFPIPDKTREAIVRIGLNGGTGRLAVDEVELTVTAR